MFTKPIPQATPHDFLDQLTLRKYFYSFRDITIGGQCPCNGHASECPVDQTTMVSGKKKGVETLSTRSGR